VLRELMDWDRRSSEGERRLGQVLLLLGGLVILVSAYLALRHPSDRVAYTLLAPGFIAGLAVIGFALQQGRRVRERHVLASAIRKLRGEA